MFEMIFDSVKLFFTGRLFQNYSVISEWQYKEVNLECRYIGYTNRVQVGRISQTTK